MEPPERGGQRETPRAASGKLPRAPTVVASGALKAKEETKPPVEWGNFLNQTLVVEGRLPSAFPKAGVGLLPWGYGPATLGLWACSIRSYGPACPPQSPVPASGPVLSPSLATLLPERVLITLPRCNLSPQSIN